eukprot:1842956-Pleurochrysis_carterae.AAC.1
MSTMPSTPSAVAAASRLRAHARHRRDTRCDYGNHARAHDASMVRPQPKTEKNERWTHTNEDAHKRLNRNFRDVPFTDAAMQRFTKFPALSFIHLLHRSILEVAQPPSGLHAIKAGAHLSPFRNMDEAIPRFRSRSLSGYLSHRTSA